MSKIGLKNMPLLLGYTFSMKTAVSIPDNIFEDAEIMTKKLGLARSQLYVKAIQEFIDRHNKDYVTEKLNTLYSEENKSEEPLDIGVESLREATKNDSW
jgi:hypothetical protein